MGPENPIVAVAAALHAATLRDLAAIEYVERDWERHRAWVDAMTREERAKVEECLVTVFPQVWGSTALGYGGIGGAAMSTAYTVVVESRIVAQRAVYFGRSGRLAYLVPMGAGAEENFSRALAERAMPSVRDAALLGWLPVAACVS